MMTTHLLTIHESNMKQPVEKIISVQCVTVEMYLGVPHTWKV